MLLSVGVNSLAIVVLPTAPTSVMQNWWILGVLLTAECRVPVCRLLNHVVPSVVAAIFAIFFFFFFFFFFFYNQY